MAKLFINGKKALSLILTLAVLAVSLFTGFIVNAISSNGEEKIPCGERKIIAWDGTQASGIATGSGSKDDPYIIKTAEELAWLVTQKIDVTAGKYYKVADDIGAIVLQSADKADAIIALEDSSAVKAYFENSSNGTFHSWKTVGWEQSGFAGYFDGNGVTIYGLRTSGARSNAALFSNVEGGAAIRNTAIKNSYITADMTNGGTTDLQVGSLFAISLTGTTSPRRHTTVWAEGCVVANNYMRINRNNKNDFARAGVIGNVTEAVLIENCLVYGNDAAYDDGQKWAVIGSLQDSAYSQTSYYDGLVVKKGTEAGQTYVYSTFRNVLALDAELFNVKLNAKTRTNSPDCYENCYTDGLTGTVQFADNSWTYNDEQIKAVTIDDLKDIVFGDAFITTGAIPELKSFHDAMFDIVDNGDGTHSQSCSCGFALSEEEHEMIDGEVEAEGNCTTDRVVAQVCSVCGAAGTDKVTTAPGHIEGEAVIENKVVTDCVTDGSYDEVVYCTVCEAEMSRTHVDGEKLGHKFKNIEAIEANCKAGGCIAHKVCENCEKYFAADDADVYSVEYLDYDKDIAIDIDATAHKLVKYVELAPTYENEGVKEHYACSYCEKLYADAEGKEEVETKDLLIDKLVKEDDKSSTDDKTEEDKDSTDDKTSTDDKLEDNKIEVDNDTTSPATGEDVINVVAIAAVVALIGLAFVVMIKVRKA